MRVDEVYTALRHRKRPGECLGSTRHQGFTACGICFSVGNRQHQWQQ